jgi:hypothetical protein
MSDITFDARIVGGFIRKLCNDARPSSANGAGCGGILSGDEAGTGEVAANNVKSVMKEAQATSGSTANPARRIAAPKSAEKRSVDKVPPPAAKAPPIPAVSPPSRKRTAGPLALSSKSSKKQRTSSIPPAPTFDKRVCI